MKGDHTVLTLDLGSEFGWAFVKNAKLLHSGEVSLLQGSQVHPGQRYAKFQQFLERFRKVDEVVIEEIPFFETVKAAKVYNGLRTLTELFSYQYGPRFRYINVSSIKLEFTGKGNADKLRMCEVAHKLGWKKGQRGTDFNHNEADAVAIAYVAMKRRGCTLVFPD